MFKNYAMTFTQACNNYVQKQYKKADIIVEYGSGGSTLLGAKLGKYVVSVESSSSWLLGVLGAAVEQNLPGKIVPIWTDIGVTKEWGFPVDESNWKNWSDYPRLPWQYCKQHNLSPDVVLIDGRFRLACFLSACVSVTKETLILFDDYEDRKYYHVAEQLFPKIEVIDNRMAVFKVVPNKVSSQFLLDYLHYFSDAR
jgi:hypothetical protein